MASENFLKIQRLRTEEDFSALRGCSRKLSGKFVHLYFTERNSRPYSRVAFSISKKAGNSPFRNLLKRKFRESYRKDKKFKSIPIDVLFVVKPSSQLSLVKKNKLEMASMINDDFVKLSERLCEKYK